MADPQYSVKKITDLTTNPSANDSDLYVLGNQGTATMRKITFSTIASAILNKLTSFTFNSLTTSSKNLPGAVNELNTNLGDIRFKRLVVPSNKSSFKFTLAAANERHILWSLDSSNNRIGMYAIYTNSSGGVGYNAMVSASGYTVSMSGSTITFAFSTVVTPVFADMVLIGTPMTVS